MPNQIITMNTYSNMLGFVLGNTVLTCKFGRHPPASPTHSFITHSHTLANFVLPYTHIYSVLTFNHI